MGPFKITNCNAVQPHSVLTPHTEHLVLQHFAESPWTRTRSDSEEHSTRIDAKGSAGWKDVSLFTFRKITFYPISILLSGTTSYALSLIPHRMILILSYCFIIRCSLPCERRRGHTHNEHMSSEIPHIIVLSKVKHITSGQRFWEIISWDVPSCRTSLCKAPLFTVHHPGYAVGNTGHCQPEHAIHAEMCTRTLFDYDE